MLRIDNPPAYFNLGMNVVQPGHGAGIGLIYRQCFAPITMLYYVLKDPNDPGQAATFSTPNPANTPPSQPAEAVSNLNNGAREESDSPQPMTRRRANR